MIGAFDGDPLQRLRVRTPRQHVIDTDDRRKTLVGRVGRDDAGAQLVCGVGVPGVE